MLKDNLYIIERERRNITMTADGIKMHTIDLKKINRREQKGRVGSMVH